MADFDKTIIAKYISGQCSDEELAQLLDWVKLSDDNARELCDAEQIYLSLKSASMDAKKVDSAFENLRFHLSDEVKNESHAISAVRRWRYIAILLLLVAAGLGLWFFGGRSGGRVPQQYTYVSAPMQGVSKVILPDGSRVWLNAGSRLRYLRDFADSVRKVDLRGEAYFELAHNAKRPFVVSSNILVVRGNGVAFNFSNDRRLNRADVSLADGSLEVWCRHRSGMVTLLPGQKAWLDRNTGQFSVVDTDPRTDAMWHNDFIPLHSASMADIARMLAGMYKTGVKAVPSPSDSITYSGQLPRKNTVVSMLEVLQKKIPMEWHKEHDTIYIQAR